MGLRLNSAAVLLCLFGLSFSGSILMAQSEIGVAKSANSSGREIAIDLYLENFGMDALTNLSLVEDLDGAFGSGNYTIIISPFLDDDPGTITLNGSFDGSGDTALISSGSLNAGDTAKISFVVEIITVGDVGFGPGVYSNQVTASGMNGGGMQSDLSDDGTDPDPNGNGDPTEAGEDDPTIIDLLSDPVIGVSKNAIVNGMVLTFDFFLETFGNRTLSNVSLIDNLDAVFGAGNFTIVSPPTFLDDPGTLVLNAAFDGSSSPDLIASGSLFLGDTARIRVGVNVTALSDQGLGLGVYDNQAVASGQAPSGESTMDLSGNGIDPDSDSNDNPNETIDNQPTRIVIGEDPVVGVAKSAAVNNSTVTLDLYLENLGNTTVSMLDLTDDLNATFGAGNYFVSTSPVLIDNPGTIVLDASYDGNFNTQIFAPGVSSLAAGDTAQVQMVVTVLSLADLGFGLGNYQNQAMVTGQAAGGGRAIDLSDDGTDPDPNGNGDPLENGENDPTQITVLPIASLGVSKSYSTQPLGPSTRIFLTFTLTNYGNQRVSGITIDEDLNGVYGAGNFSHFEDPSYVSGAVTLNYNAAFNGNTDTNLLNAGSFLDPGETSVFRIASTLTNVTDQGFGLGVYQNQVTANGLDPLANPVNDVSTAGDDPDPNGDGTPDEMDPTVINVNLAANIGLAKDVSVAGGSITFDLFLENLGDVNLDQLGLADNLDDVFGAGNYTISTPPFFVDDPGTITLDPAYDGSTSTELLVPGSSSLASADTAQIQMVVDILNVVDQGLGLGNYSNQADTLGRTPQGDFVSDISDFGTDPDPNGNGNANESGENDPATFMVVIDAPLGVAKQAMVADHTVTIDIYLENRGVSMLSNVGLIDDLDATFGSGNYAITTPPSFIVDPGTLTLSGTFDGSGDTQLLDPSSTLGAGATAQIQMAVEVLNESDQGNGFGVYSNQAVAAGTQTNGLVVQDSSDDGTDPDPNGNGDPGEAGENDPTPIVIAGNPAIGISKKAYVSGTMVAFDFYVENLGDSTISNLFMEDPLNPVFGSGNYSILTQPFNVTGPGTANLSPQFFGFNIFSRIILGGFINPGETIHFRTVISVNNVTDVGNGFGIYHNQVTVTGTDPGGGMVMDVSDDGYDPDPNGNGDAGDAGEDDTTVITIGDESNIGVAKAASVIGQQVTLDYAIENFGNSQLSGLSLTEDLDTVFGPGNYMVNSGPTLIDDPGTMLLNAGFDGSSDMEIFDPGDTLPALDTATIRLVVDVTNVVDLGFGFGNYVNQVLVSGSAPLGTFSQDLSDNGTDPDPNGSGFPSDIGEDDPTTFSVGITFIGAAKNATVNGSQVTFDFYVENLGTTGLNNVSMSENLDSIFGPGNYTLVSGPTLIGPPRALLANADFDGSTDTALIEPGPVGLGVTEQFQIVVDVLELIDSGSGLGVYTNQITATADGGASDLSDDGTDPDPNGNSDPTEAGENDPTVFSIGVNPQPGVAKTVSVNGTTVTVNLFLEAFGNVDLDNLSLTEDLDGLFGTGNYSILMAPALIVDPGTLTLNATFDGGTFTDILVPASSAMTIGTTAQIRFSVQVTNVTDQGFGLGIYQNQVTFSGTAPDATMGSDVSDDGMDPDPDGDGDPNEGGENDPSLFELEGTIGDRVYNDLNGNGVDDGEPGLSGVVVFLDSNTNGSLDLGEPMETTDGTGAYDFTNVAAGNYSVMVDATTVPTGFALTTPSNPVAVALSAGEDNNTTDFGYQQQDATIGDFVFNDADGDGIEDGGKSGLATVLVYLDLNSNGSFDGGEPNELTDGSGAFDFTNLATGTYVVDIDPTTVPPGFVLTTANLPLIVNLAAGEDYNDADFGYQQQDASIGDFVWNDLNGDGIQDGGEPGISGVSIYLDLNGNGTFDGGEPNDTSDGAGAYDIMDLPLGTYTVRVDGSSLPVGFVLTSANDPMMVNLGVGEDFNDADFGFQQQDATIGDRVFNDLDGDGVDSAEPGLSGVLVYLDLNTNGMFDGGEPNDTTDGTGAYDITNLPTGTYMVSVDASTVPAGYVLTTAAPPLSVPLAAGEDYNDADFGYQRQDGVIGDFVWNDLNGDGVQDGGEPGFANVTLDLIDDANGNGAIDGGEMVLATTMTDGSGIYAFTNLAVGDYIVNLTDTNNVLTAYVQTGGVNPQAVALAKGGSITDIDFGFQREDGTIGDFVWNDLNGDGIQDGGEPGFDNVTLDLIEDTNGNGVIDGGEPVVDTQTTAGGGLYDFTNLTVGDYLVRVTDTNNVLTAYVLTGGTDPLPVALVKGGDFNDADFGFQRQDGTIGDFVWNDLNGDGIQDGGEPGFDNVSLDLIEDTNGNGAIDGGEPVLDTQTTAGGGLYDFTNLPVGDYLVTVTDTNNVLAAYVLTGGTDPLPVALVKGGDFNDADFGFLRQDGAIGDFVWNDLNGDGVQDGGEPGLQNVTLDLIEDTNGNGAIDGGEPVLDTQTTDVNGAYDFTNLAFGDYVVTVTDTNNVLAAYTLTGGMDPLAVTLIKGENFNDADFGYQREDGAIGDLVWHDFDGNGLFDPGEPGIENVTLDLIEDTNGNGAIDGGEPVLDTQTTDVNGAYDFTGLTVGDYIVQVTDTNAVLDGFMLTGGTDPLAVNLAKGGDFDEADFGYLDERARIGVAKSAEATTLMIAYTFHVENFGAVLLTDLSMPEDLDGVFGAGTYLVVEAPTVVGGNAANASGNPNFDGSTDQELFAAGSELDVGESVELRIQVEITDPPEPVDGPVSYTNQVVVSAIGLTGNPVQDESTDGDFPDPDGNGNPGDDGTATLVYLPLPVPTLGEWGLGLLLFGLLVAGIWMKRRNRAQPI